MKSQKELIVVLTGAGISAESGLRTFRDSGGLWEGYKVEDVATPQAWEKDPALVLRFYNERRKALEQAKPNAAHTALAELERSYTVAIITQNVDDLHERAGSSDVVHLHGELRLARSTLDGSLHDIPGGIINLGDCCPHGGQLRPHIVWFGEAVPLFDEAITITEQAKILIVVGTSLAVYPAASLVHYAPSSCKKYLVDPGKHFSELPSDITVISEKASSGVTRLVQQLLSVHDT